MRVFVGCAIVLALTINLHAQDTRNQPPRQPPTYQNITYGPHDRNVMDVWLAKSESPTPVLVSIHGGGFRSGNKGVNPGLLRECLQSGISVVAITYRLSGDSIGFCVPIAYPEPNSRQPGGGLTRAAGPSGGGIV